MKKVTRESVKKDCERLYRQYVRNWMAGKLANWFPKRIVNSAIRMDYNRVTEIQGAVAALEREAKTEQRPGFRLERADRKRRNGGTNSEVLGIYIDSEQDLLAVSGKFEDFKRLQHVRAFLQSELPELEDWMRRNPLKLSSIFEIVEELVQVVKYLKAHPRPGVFARELPVPVGSKFVEKHQGILDQWLSECSRDLRVFGETNFFLKYGLRDDKEHHAINILDDTIQRELNLPFKEFSLTTKDLHNLPLHGVRVVFVENLVNLLTLPSSPRTIGVAAKGKFVNQFASLPWLANCELYYWGDFDVEGFGILASFRSALHSYGLEIPVVSRLMDRVTYDAFEEFSRLHKAAAVSAPLQWLTPDERAMFDHLLQQHRRLEQEYITQAFVQKNLLPV